MGFGASVTNILRPFLDRIRIPSRSRGPVARIEVHRAGRQLGLWAISDDKLDVVAFIDHLEMIVLLDFSRSPEIDLMTYTLRVVREQGLHGRIGRDAFLRLAVRAEADFANFGNNASLCS